MITRKSYLKALDIVEAYHKQLNIADVGRSLKVLAIGDKIIFDVARSKYVTIGKLYKINRVRHWEDGTGVYSFYDDRGKSKLMKLHTNGYVWRLP